MTDDEVVALLREQGGTPEELLADRDTLAFFLRPSRAIMALKSRTTCRKGGGSTASLRRYAKYRAQC